MPHIDDTSTNNPPATVNTWSIRAIAILLLFQAAGLIYISYDLLAAYNWSFLEDIVGSAAETTAQTLAVPAPQLEAVETTLTLAPLALLAIISAIGFLFPLRLGWILAMMTQGLILWACLSLYVSRKPFFIYPLMLSCILMVLYLNAFHVRVAFQPISTPEAEHGS